ncbi:MAG: glycoside hydrolase family 92 protein, partial [Mycobacterium sp.]|nr:glycoside hydrolase family 92 protein [Mycobacterium sp.]
PLFPHAVIHLPNGKAITINAPNAAPDASYVQNVQKNGEDWPKNYLTGGQYSNGVTLDYDLTTTPNTSRGTVPAAAPPSYRSGEAKAIGFTKPWGAVVTSAGQSINAQLGVQSQVNQPLTLTWTATTPTDIQLAPSSGSVPVPAGGQASPPITINVADGTPTGTYPVHISFTDTAGEQVTTADIEVQVSPPVGTANVCTTLGSENISNGLTQVDWPADGLTGPVETADMTARTMVKATDPADFRYMYFNLDDGIAHDGNFQASITITYLDLGTKSFVVQYDSNNPSGAHAGAYTTAGSVPRTNTGTWKTATLTVPDARFANRQNAGTDFRIVSNGPGDANAVTVHSAEVTVTGPGVLPVNLCSS